MLLSEEGLGDTSPILMQKAYQLLIYTCFCVCLFSSLNTIGVEDGKRILLSQAVSFIDCSQRDDTQFQLSNSDSVILFTSKQTSVSVCLLSSVFNHVCMRESKKILNFCALQISDNDCMILTDRLIYVCVFIQKFT